MISITMAALIVPILCVALAAKYYLQPDKPVDNTAFAPLQKALEDVADKSFEEKTSLASDSLVILSGPDVGALSKKVENQAERMGGVVLPGESLSPDEVRLLVQIPAKKAKAFVAAIENDLQSETAASTDDDLARTLIEVVIKKKAE